METRPDTQASSLPSSSSALSQPPEGRDLDWEDYNYRQDTAAGGGQQGDLENPLAAMLFESHFKSSFGNVKAFNLKKIKIIAEPAGVAAMAAGGPAAGGRRQASSLGRA